MRILFRYLSAQILAPFFTCLLGFIFLWVVFDIFDNGSDFIEAKAPFSLVVKFYWVQLPSMLAVGLPLAVLLASLFCLINLSRRNEFVAMQSSGLSLWQIGLPFIVLGLLTSLFLGFLHWKAAPEALKKREAILEDLEVSRDLAKKSRKKSEEVGVFQSSVVYRNPKSNRIWFIEKAEVNKARLQQVEILQVTPEGKDVWKYYIDTMNWDGEQWRMHQVLRIVYDGKGNVSQSELLSNFQDPRLEETFLEVTSLMKNPEALSVPELEVYVAQNIHSTVKRLAPYQTLLYYRRAIGVTCLAIILMALTFALTSSKRNLLAGFSKTVVIYFAFLIVIHFFIALGKGGRIPPGIAGYLPAVLFLLSSIALFYWKTTRVELPSLIQFLKKS
ncbi:MAG: LptF/LptG family permease [Verrucomicrobiae bacterium]|nr:LptF/LptG family permease [Verrucomicrobiae bacterium]